MYILIEVTTKKFLIAKLNVGSKTEYTLVAECKNRGQAERFVEVLNK